MFSREKLEQGGATFVRNRNSMGLETAQDLVCVQQNYPMTRAKCDSDTFESCAEQQSADRVHIDA
jgi:hypothetical protein